MFSEKLEEIESKHLKAIDNANRLAEVKLQDLMMQKEMRTMKTDEISKQQIRQKKQKQLWQAETMDKYTRIKMNMQNL